MTKDGAEDIRQSTEIVAIVEEQIRDMVDDLKGYREQIQESLGIPRPSELRKELKDIRDAIVVLMQERGRLNELRAKYSGAVDGGAIDFEAARLEVGRLLDRLRNAAGAADVPG